MAFIDGTDPAPRMLIGPADGARALFRERARYATDFFVGLHTHEGDESFDEVSRQHSKVLDITQDLEHYRSYLLTLLEQNQNLRRDLRKFAGADLLALGQHDRAEDRILELPDIARPIGGGQQ